MYVCRYICDYHVEGDAARVDGEEDVAPAHQRRCHTVYLVLGFGFRVSGFEFRVSGFRFGVWGLGFEVWGLGCMILGSGFGI